MTVADLIKILNKLDPDARVMVRGYEGGYCNPVIDGPVDIYLNVYDSDFYGPNGKKGEGWEDPTGIVRSIIIDRSGR